LEKKKKCIYSLQPGHLEAEQNDRKIKRSKIKRKGVKNREFLVESLLPVKIITSGRMASARKKNNGKVII